VSAGLPHDATRFAALVWGEGVPPGVGMRNTACARRTVLRLLASCAAIEWVFDAASAQPPGRGEPLPRRKPVRHYLPIIVIDPGHGGIDPGAIAPDGVYEKNIVYPTSRYLAVQLLATGLFRVALTRGPDEFVPLRERVARARALHADLFLALHADALPDPAKHGLSVFTLSAKASDREAAALAESENQDVVDRVRLAREPRLVGDILIDLERRQTDNSSLKFARDLVTALGHEVALLYNPQRSADFAVLTAPDIPSALVELGCLSNPAEERLLQQPAYQRRLARGLMRGIEAYFLIPRPG
jgi:N-acetylmuramoyl-L-alanine amidase